MSSIAAGGPHDGQNDKSANDTADDARRVKFESRARAQHTPDEPTDERTRNAERTGHEDAHALFARHDGLCDEAGDDSEHDEEED